MPLHQQSAVSLAIDALVLDAPALAHLLAEAANAGDDTSISWFSNLIGKHVANDVLQQIARAVRSVRRISHPTLDTKARKFYWKHEFTEADDIPNIEAAFGLVALRIVNADLTSNLHQCALKE